MLKSHPAVRRISSCFRIVINVCIYVWIYENGVENLNSHPKLVFFFLTRVNDINIKSKVSAFFPPSTRLSSFHCPPSSTFCPFTGPKEGLKVHSNQGLGPVL